MMQPRDEAELSEMVRGANGPLVLRGGGTRTLGVAAGEVLDLSGLSGISLYEPGALTLAAGAGTPLAQIEEALAAERQRLAFEVPDLRGLLGRGGASTLGGVAAANASGPRRVQVGACRDHLLGLRFVNGLGVAVKSGGRVMKNVTGLDLVKLLAGSQGTLGLITEVALKVQAVPEAQVTLVARRGLDDGLAALRSALGSPFDVSGAAYADGAALIRVEGMAGSVAYRAGALRNRLGGDWDVEDGADLWRAVRDVSAFAGADGAVWRVSVKPSDAGAVIAALAGVAHKAMFDWGGGLVWLLLAEGLDVRARLAAGHATLVRALPGMGHIPVFQPEPPGVAALTRGLRARFDPRGILNAGMMG
jgi:glycolate oxidase FAD binding subunit